MSVKSYLRHICILWFHCFAVVSASYAESVARLDNEMLTDADIKAAIASLPPDLVTRLSESELSARNLAKDLLNRRIIAAQAREQQLQSDPIVEARIRQATEWILYDTYMAQVDRGVSAEAVSRLARDEYRAEADRYQSPERIKVRHMLFNKGEDPDEAFDRARIARARVIAGEDFTELAKTLSEDEQTRSKGGLLGTFRRGQLVAEFEKVAFDLEPGKISDPVETTFGFHLILVDERLPAGQLSFDEVQASIESRIRQQLISAGRAKLLEPLGKIKPVEADVDVIMQTVKEQLSN